MNQHTLDQLGPYPGLRPFRRNETEIFFGREAQVDVLLEKLQKTHFIAVVGPSGCGKSSLVRTGVLSALESGFMVNAGASWVIADSHPGNQPYQNLSKALLADNTFSTAYRSYFSNHQDSTDNKNSTNRSENKVINQPESFLQASLQRGSLSMHELLDGIEPLNNTSFLLLIDQFEEIFRYNQKDQAIATDFVNLLLSAIEHPRVYVIITMRSDFLGNAAHFQRLPEAINESLFLTPRLERDELAEAISLPARMFGGEVKSDLVNYLLNEAGTSPDQLPLLQHAMMRLWDRDEDKILTLDEYKAFGNLQLALDDHAEEAFAELDSSGKLLAEKIFRILTERSEKRDIRSPATLGELAAITSEESSRLIPVIDVFRQQGRNFLIPPAKVELTDNTMIDISHESLIRQWKRLKKWVDKEAEDVELYRRLEGSALRYKEGKGALLETPDLENALYWLHFEKPTSEWANRYGNDYQNVLDYLQLSEKKKARKRYRSLRTFVIAIALAVLTALMGWGVAYSKIKETQRLQYQLLISLAASNSATEKYSQAKELLKEKIETFDGDVSNSDIFVKGMAQRQIEMMGQSPTFKLESSGKSSYVVETDLQNHWLISGDREGTLSIYDIRHQENSAIHDKSENNAMGTKSADRTHLNHKLVHQLKYQHADRIIDIVFHPHGKWFATSGSKKFVTFWTMPSRETPPRKILNVDLSNDRSLGVVRAMSVHPNGNILVVGGTGRGAKGKKVVIWDVSKIGNPNYAPKISFLGRKTARGQVSEGGLTFSPDGRWLVYATDLGFITAWKTDDAGIPVEMNWEITLPERALAVTFSPDSKIVAAGVGNQILLWGIEKKQPKGSFSGHKGHITSLKFVSADQYAQPLLVSSSYDQTLRVYDTYSGTTLRVLQGHEGVVSLSRMAYTEHSNILYSVGTDGQLLGWRIDLPWQKLVTVGKTLPSALTLTHDDDTLLVGTERGGMQLFSLSEGKALLSKCEKGNARYCAALNTWPFMRMQDVAQRRFKHFPKNNRLATAITGNGVHAIEVLETNDQGIPVNGHGDEITTHQSHIWDVDISPDEKYMATAGWDDVLKLINLETREEIAFKPDFSDVDFVEFDQHGHLMANTDEAIYFWDIKDIEDFRRTDNTDEPAVKPLISIPASTSLRDTGISPNGKWLASVGAGANVELFALGPDGLPKEGERFKLTNGEHTLSVYRLAFSSNSRLLATLGNDGVIQIWDTETRSALFHLNLPTDVLTSRHYREFAFPCTDKGCYIVAPISYKDTTKGTALIIYDFMNLK